MMYVVLMGINDKKYRIEYVGLNNYIINKY